MEPVDLFGYIQKTAPGPPPDDPEHLSCREITVLPGERWIRDLIPLHGTLLETVDDRINLVKHPDHLEELNIPGLVGDRDLLPGKPGADLPKQVNILLPGPDDPAIPGNLPVDGDIRIHIGAERGRPLCKRRRVGVRTPAPLLINVPEPVAL